MPSTIVLLTACSWPRPPTIIQIPSTQKRTPTKQGPSSASCGSIHSINGDGTTPPFWSSTKNHCPTMLADWTFNDRMQTRLYRRISQKSHLTSFIPSSDLFSDPPFFLFSISSVETSTQSHSPL
jgi:hypothetical protein